MATKPNKPTVELCLAALKKDITVIKFISDYMLIRINNNIIIDHCIAFHRLKLPSYVLLEIIDRLLYESPMKEIDKINKIIQINERYR